MAVQEKSTVVLIHCDTYDEKTVYERLKTGVELLGGIRSMVSPEEKLLLKPNLLRKSDLSRAVVTHPTVIGAVGRLCTEAGIRDVKAGDSCGFGSALPIMKQVGMDEVLAGYGITSVEFTDGGNVEYPEGIQTQQLHMSKEVLEADAMINICKMKTHALERITGAVKNMYGCIYSVNKAKGHTQFPTPDSFARVLIDINRFVKPRLYVMDGITAMEGNGPASGDPVDMHVMLVSRDPVALDSVFCRLVNLDPKLVPTNFHGEKMGLGVWQEDKIRLLLVDPDREKAAGTEISFREAYEHYGNPGFRVDRSRKKAGIWARGSKLLNIFQKKPYIQEDLCRKCGICVKSCPMEGAALDFTKGKDQPPVYNYRKCIRCFCCQEMCPHKAIKVK